MLDGDMNDDTRQLLENIRYFFYAGGGACEVEIEGEVYNAAVIQKKVSDLLGY